MAKFIEVFDETTKKGRLINIEYIITLGDLGNGRCILTLTESMDVTVLADYKDLYKIIDWMNYEYREGVNNVYSSSSSV